MSIHCRLLLLYPGVLEAEAPKKLTWSQEIPVGLWMTASAALPELMREDSFVTYPLPEGMELDGPSISGEEGWPNIDSDRFGPLRYCFPSSFATIELEDEELEHPLNKAALAYIAALPDDWPMVLYWT